MVNENQGKVYEPLPVYNRKLARTVLRSKLKKKYGYGENKRLAEYFHKYQTLVCK